MWIKNVSLFARVCRKPIKRRPTNAELQKQICTNFSKTFLRLKTIQTKPLQLILGSIKKIMFGKSKALFSVKNITAIYR